MMRNLDEIKPKGHLEVWKIYDDGRPEELHFSDNNIIVSGMGLGLAYLFAGSGSTKITDFQVRWFQVGVSGTSTGFGVSTNNLVSALNSTQYGVGDAVIDVHNQYRAGITFNNVAFAFIPYNHVYRVSPTSVRFHLFLGKNNCNDLSVPLNEAGLYMHNFRSQATTESLLVAYKYYSPILKTDDFALLFRWTISF